MGHLTVAGKVVRSISFALLMLPNSPKHLPHWSINRKVRPRYFGTWPRGTTNKFCLEPQCVLVNRACQSNQCLKNSHPLTCLLITVAPNVPRHRPRRWVPSFVYIRKLTAYCKSDALRRSSRKRLVVVKAFAGAIVIARVNAFRLVGVFEEMTPAYIYNKVRLPSDTDCVLPVRCLSSWFSNHSWWCFRYFCRSHQYC